MHFLFPFLPADNSSHTGTWVFPICWRSAAWEGACSVISDAGARCKRITELRWMEGGREGDGGETRGLQSTTGA